MNQISISAYMHYDIADLPNLHEISAYMQHTIADLADLHEISACI